MAKTTFLTECRCPDAAPDEHRLSHWHNTGGPPCWGNRGLCGQAFIDICSCHSPVRRRLLPVEDGLLGGGYEFVCHRSGEVLVPE